MRFTLARSPLAAFVAFAAALVAASSAAEARIFP
ncbi:MAG: hypothetical protein QG573_4, partial [Acidobacteriota bacterium]|nr:hypothetical protein [Acidobacteriota bacterium]